MSINTKGRELVKEFYKSLYSIRRTEEEMLLVMRKEADSRRQANFREIFLSAGIHLMQKDILEYMPKEKSFSLEYDVFPMILGYSWQGAA